MFGVPVLMLCLLLPLFGDASPVAQGLLILFSLAIAGALARWCAPSFERKVTRNGVAALR